MRILVSNDDGINSEGIKALVNEMKKLGEVIVSAPAEGQSGAGHSITFNHYIKMEKVQFDQDVQGFKVFGRPRDCVELALCELVKDVDLVVSGINEGCNLACDASASGTCGAACSALAYGVPSIAVSFGFGDSYDYSIPARKAREIAKWFIEQPFKNDFTLSINVPNVKEEEIKGIVTSGFGGYTKYKQDTKVEFDGQYYYYNLKTTEVSYNYSKQDLTGDLYALSQNYITLTPLSLNMVKEDSLKELSESFSRSNIK